jgi:cephalosporin-C deacetylase
MLPNQYGSRPGLASISLNYFGESSFHQEVYSPARGYFAQGIKSPRTWIFRRMAVDAMILARIFASLPEVDPGRIGAGGMSQGGGMAIWLGAACPMVRCAFADMPFLGALWPILEEAKAFRYPLKELDDWIGGDSSRKEQLLETLRWFDTAHLATLCQVPVLLTLGRKDPAVKPFQVQAIFGALAGPKELVELDWGHDWHPSMVARNEEFLAAHL